jgi:hypothetical protein
MRRLVMALLLSVALIGTVTACKSSSSTASGAKGGSVVGGTKAGGAAAAGSASDAHLPASTNVCTLMPAATVKQITGTAFDTAKTDNTPSYELFACDYTSTSVLGAEMDVSVEGMSGSVGYSADLQAFGSVKNSTTTISGLGDKAFSITIAGGAVGQIDALFGPELITVNGLSTLTNAQAKQLITQLHSALG